MAGRAYAWRMRVATANRERIAASLSAASRLPSACSRSRNSSIVLAASLNLRVCSLRYLFGILFSRCGVPLLEAEQLIAERGKARAGVERMSNTPLPPQQREGLMSYGTS